MIGKRFGRLVVVEKGDDYISPNTKYGQVRYICNCDCGSQKLIRESSLLIGYTKSCGCYARESASQRVKTHGFSEHRLFGIWHDMNRRCFDSSRKDYKHYGGRGITVDPSWADKDTGILKFIEDMGATFQEGLELDRIDVNGDYCKENCRWTTRRNQVINRRAFGSNFDTKFIEYKGKTLCLSQWADETGIAYKVLVDRLGKLKWDVEKAFNTPVRYKRVWFEHKGELRLLADLFLQPIKVHVKAKKHSMRMAEFVKSIFGNDLKIYGEITGKLYEIKTCKDLSELRSNFKLKEIYVEYEQGVKP